MTKFFIFLLSVMFILACGHTEGTIQKADQSFIVFSGNLDNVEIRIDDLEPFAPLIGKHYQLKPGQHYVTAYRGEALLVDRKIFLENQVTTEINIP
jgi:hypothetical protein